MPYSQRSKRNKYRPERISDKQFEEIISSKWITESPIQKELNAIDMKHNLDRKKRHNSMFSIMEWFFLGLFLFCVTVLMAVSLLQNFGFLKYETVTDFSFLLVVFLKMLRVGC